MEQYVLTEDQMPYHLCPVCGLQSQTTSRVCEEHTVRFCCSTVFLERLVVAGLDDIAHGRFKLWERS